MAYSNIRFSKQGDFDWQDDVTDNYLTTTCQLDHYYTGGSCHGQIIYKLGAIYMKAIMACLVGQWVTGAAKVYVYNDSELLYESGWETLLPLTPATYKEVEFSYTISQWDNVDVVMIIDGSQWTWIFWPIQIYDIYGTFTFNITN